MNLSPEWVAFLQTAGIASVHWSNAGAVAATDETIMEFARKHGQVVMTQDLDFTVLLALTRATGPSVIQIRARNARPAMIGSSVLTAITQYELDLQNGALVTIDELQSRIRVLPI